MFFRISIVHESSAAVLELLDFTIDKVAEHAAEWIPAEAAGALLRKMERLWNEEYLYQITPMTLLEFITDYIQYAPLKEIYSFLCRSCKTS